MIEQDDFLEKIAYACSGTSDGEEVLAFSQYLARTINLDAHRTFDFLIDLSTDVNASDGKYRIYLLHLAAAFDRLDLAETLLKFGMDINEKCSKGRTPLHYAARSTHPNMVKWLIQNSCNIQALDDLGSNALSVLVSFNKEKFLQRIKTEGDGIVVQMDEICHLLMNQGINIHTKDKNLCTSLHFVCGIGHDTIVDRLLEAGADVNALNCIDFAPLTYAVKNGCLNSAKKLLEKGADIHRPTIDGYTPLTLAQKYGHEQVAKLLIAHGA